MYDEETTVDGNSYGLGRVSDSLTTQDRSPIQVELDTIDKALNSLQQKTEILASKVTKVLAQHEPAPENPESKDIEPTGSHLTLELKSIKHRIYRIERTISDVSGRVEL